MGLLHRLAWQDYGQNDKAVGAASGSSPPPRCHNEVTLERRRRYRDHSKSRQMSAGDAPHTGHHNYVTTRDTYQMRASSDKEPTIHHKRATFCGLRCADLHLMDEASVVQRLTKSAEAQRFAGQLRAELNRKGWTAQDLIRAWGGSPMPYKWLKGSTAPRVDTKRRLADTLGISMMAFEPTPPNGQAGQAGQSGLETSPVEDSREQTVAEMELVQIGPTKIATVHLKVDALVTPGVAGAVMRALEGK
jgi:hypothetical protein